MRLPDPPDTYELTQAASAAHLRFLRGMICGRLVRPPRPKRRKRVINSFSPIPVILKFPGR